MSHNRSRSNQNSQSYNRNRTSTPVKTSTNSSNLMKYPTDKLEKRMDSLEKLLKEVVQQLQSNSTMNNTHFINELSDDSAIKTFITSVGTKGAVLDSGAPKELVGQKWISEYIKENNLREDDVVRKESNEKFKFGEGKIFKSQEYVSCVHKKY